MAPVHRSRAEAEAHLSLTSTRLPRPARKWSRHGTAVAALSVVSALGAVAVSQLVFPFLSINNDEAINRLQAEALAHGRLFVPAPAIADAFRPWLAAVSGDVYVLKYTPVVPAMMAASQALTGGFALHLALVAAATVAVTYLLAVEVLGDRTEALVATALVTMSPLVVVQSGLLLSYLPNLLLLEVFAWGLLRGLASGRRLLLVLGGAALGLAFFARSFDALVVAAPVVVGAVAVHRRRLSLGHAASFLAPATLGLVGLLAFNRAATGSALRLPFALLEPSDALGFGTRRLYGTDAPHQFGIREGLSGILGHGALLNVWVAGGSILLVAAVVTVLRRRVDGVGWSFVAIALVLPLSYAFFWGPWNATVLWGGTRYVGPFYFLPVVLPLALFAGRGLVDLHRSAPRMAAGAGAAITAVTAISLAVILTANTGFARNDAALARLLEGRSPKELVFATMPTPFLMHPTAVISNRWDLGGPIVYAVERGDDDLDVARMLPGHTPFRLRFEAEYRNPDEVLRARLEELRLATGDRLPLRLTARQATTPGRLGVEVSAAGVTHVYVLGEAATYKETLVVDRSGGALTGRQPATTRPAAAPGGLEVRLLLWPPGDSPHPIARVQLPLRATAAGVEALLPTGSAWTVNERAAPLLDLRA